MLSLMLMKQKIAKLELAFGMLSRAFVTAVAVSLLAAPSFVQAQATDNRVFVDLNRGTGAAGAFVEATVYIDKADPDPASGVTEGGFNAIGASLSWMNGAFTWNVNAGGTPITESANLMAGEDLMAAPGAMPNFELLQSVDAAGIGVFFETDETSSAITVTIVQTAFANVDEQILPCTFFEPPDIPPEGVANCNAFPIFRAILQVGDETVPDGTTAAEFQTVMAVASARAQSPAPGAGFMEMDEEPFERQTERSMLTVTSALSPVILDTVPAAPQEIGTLTVARNAVSDGLQARLGDVVLSISAASEADLDNLLNAIDLTVAATVADAVNPTFDDITPAFEPTTPVSGGGFSAEVRFVFPFDASNGAENIAEGSNAVLTLSVSLDTGSNLADGTEYTLSLTSVGVVGEDGMSESAPRVDALPITATAMLELRVTATALRWVNTDSDRVSALALGTIQAGAVQALVLHATDAFGNLDSVNSFEGEVSLSLSAGTGTSDPNPVAFGPTDGGVAMFDWSHWPGEDMESFTLTASAGSFSGVEATGVSDAVADTLSFAAEITVEEEGEDPVPGATNLVAGASNSVVSSLMAQDCMDAAGTVQSCVTDTGVTEDGIALSVTYTFEVAQIPDIGNGDVVSGTALPATVNFTSGETALAERVFTNPVLADGVDDATVMLSFSVDLSSLGIIGLGIIMGDGTLTMIPGGPDINANLSGDAAGAVDFVDVLLLIRSLQGLPFSGIIAGQTVLLDEEELTARFQGLVASEEANLSGDTAGAVDFVDVLLLIRSLQGLPFSGIIAGQTVLLDEEELTARFVALRDSGRSGP